MSKFLIATHPIAGHMSPGIPIVRELVRRGHEVRWYCGRKYRALAEAAGAVYEPYHQAYDFDDADYDRAFPGRSKLTGVDRARFDVLRVFLAQVAHQHRDLDRALEGFRADAVIGDPALYAAQTITETGGPPNAVYSFPGTGLPGRDVAPFGVGMRPNSVLSRARALEIVASRVVSGKLSVELSQQCVAVGAAPRPFRGPAVSPYLVLQASTPSFEHSRSVPPPQAHFVGALLPPAPEATLPEWWNEVVSADRPVVLLVQGADGSHPRDFLAPAIRGLAGEDVLVVAVGVRDVGALGPLPANVRTAPFVPFGALLPHVAVFMSHGGYGGVQHALSAGVPLVVAGGTEGGAETGDRVARSGAGIHLRGAALRPGQVRDSVRAVLTEPGYRERARVLRAELAAHDGPSEAADLLERLAATRRAVFR